MALLVSVPISSSSSLYGVSSTRVTLGLPCKSLTIANFSSYSVLGKMMKRENRGLGEENEKEFFFFLLGFSFKHDLCIFHCLVELVDFRYPGFASSNFL
jgi:hypothetical protein